MSWWTLKTILDTNREIQADERRNPAPICPIDGELLNYSPTRRLWDCPMGNYQTRAPRPVEEQEKRDLF